MSSVNEISYMLRFVIQCHSCMIMIKIHDKVCCGKSNGIEYNAHPTNLQADYDCSIRVILLIFLLLIDYNMSVTVAQFHTKAPHQYCNYSIV